MRTSCAGVEVCSVAMVAPTYFFSWLNVTQCEPVDAEGALLHDKLRIGAMAVVIHVRPFGPREEMANLLSVADPQPIMNDH